MSLAGIVPEAFALGPSDFDLLRRSWDQRGSLGQRLITGCGVRLETSRPTGFEATEEPLLDGSGGRVHSLNLDLTDCARLLKRVSVVEEIGGHIPHDDSILGPQGQGRGVDGVLDITHQEQRFTWT